MCKHMYLVTLTVFCGLEATTGPNHAGEGNHTKSGVSEVGIMDSTLWSTCYNQ